MAEVAQVESLRRRTDVEVARVEKLEAALAQAEHPQIVDFAWARPGGQAIKDAGYVGVVRYLAPLPNGKVLTKDEVAEYLALGLSVAVVWETTPGRALAGFAAGAADAQAANDMAAKLGLSSSITIYYAVDTDIVDVTAVAPYFQGANSIGPRSVSGYGEFDVIEALLDRSLITFAWQTVAWSHGKVSNRANLYQYAGGPIPDTDVNDCLTSDWGQLPRPDQPQPAPEEEDELKLFLIQGDKTDAWWWTDDWINRTWCKSPDEAGRKVFIFTAEGRADQIVVQTGNTPKVYPQAVINDMHIVGPKPTAALLAEKDDDVPPHNPSD